MKGKRTKSIIWTSTISLFTLTFLILIIAFLSGQQAITVSADGMDAESVEADSAETAESQETEETNSPFGESGYYLAIPVDWEYVKEEISSIAHSAVPTNINLMTGEAFNIPKDVLDCIVKQNITLALHTGNRLSFSVSGTDIGNSASSIHLRLAAPGIPEAVKQPVVEGASMVYEFSMEEKNNYPFRVNAHMNLGQENAGKIAILYCYNESNNTLQPAGAFRVTDTGQAMFPLNRGDDYIAVVAEQVKGYTIQSGDTLSHIAVRNGVSLKALQAANPHIADADVISVGQVINIPTN